MSQKTEYIERGLKVDINHIDGDGVFPCPNCGTTISPEDRSEKNIKSSIPSIKMMK